MPLLWREFIEPEPEAFHDLKHEMSECQLLAVHGCLRTDHPTITRLA